MTASQCSRREALKKIFLSAGLASSPLWAQSLTFRALAHQHHPMPGPAAEAAGWSPRFLSVKDYETVVTLSDRIIPETDTPGARAAGVGRFIDDVLAESEAEEQREFSSGLALVDERSRERFGQVLTEADATQQDVLLSEFAALDEADPRRVFFGTLKRLTITGFYTSEVGYFQELHNDGRMFFEDFAGCQEPDATIEQWLHQSLALRDTKP